MESQVRGKAGEDEQNEGQVSVKYVQSSEVDTLASKWECCLVFPDALTWLGWSKELSVLSNVQNNRLSGQIEVS